LLLLYCMYMKINNILKLQIFMVILLLTVCLWGIGLETLQKNKALVSQKFIASPLASLFVLQVEMGMWCLLSDSVFLFLVEWFDFEFNKTLHVIPYQQQLICWPSQSLTTNLYHVTQTGNLHRGFIFDKVEIVVYDSDTKGKQGAAKEPSVVFGPTVRGARGE
jgi:hypothetical protein